MTVKKDVLLQDVNNLNVAGLCKDNKCKFKAKYGDEFPEVVIIEKVEDGFHLTKLPPLVQFKQEETYRWAEEVLYHLLPEFTGVTPEFRTNILTYFGEKE